MSDSTMLGAVLTELKGFDVGAATATLWVFKKSISLDRKPSFTGRWIQTTDDLDNALKTAINSERSRITELQEYSLLALPNESSALALPRVETHADIVVDQAAADLDVRRARRLKQIQNTAFYVVKLVAGDNVLYGVKKADFSWRTKREISVVFTDDTLDLVRSPSFEISQNIDFFILDETVIISRKTQFESILNYKAAHIEDFALLKKEPEFVAIFSNLDCISDYVGDNKIQLRRASAIKQKAYYKDSRFMERLRSRYQEFGLNLSFDLTGRIVPSSETCRDIFQALLDHRLGSAFSTNVYDVQDAARIAV